MRHLHSLLACAIVVSVLAIAAPAMAAVHRQDNFEPASLEGVDSISIEGSGTVTITIGDPPQITVEGSDAAIQALNVVTTDDEIEIEPADNATPGAGAEELHFDITVPSLEDLRLRGAMQLEAAGIVGNELRVRLEGSSTATITGVDVNEFDVRLEGASLLTVAGSANELDLEVHESSTFDGSELETGSAEIDAFDASMAVVNVTGELEVEVNAAAIVEYIGEPASTDFDMNVAGIVRPFSGAAATPAASPEGSPSAQATPEISLAGRAFTPATIEITVGQQVTWVNDDDSEHTVSASDGSFDSGTLNEGASFSYTFETAGEFPYFCAFHPDMQGVVTVR